MGDPSSDREQTGERAATRKGAERETAGASDGVLANLPRTRPQRPSARREAARRAAARATPDNTQPTQPARAGAAREQTTAKQRPAKAKSTAKRLQDPAPRQGFESASDPVSGPVQPPSGVDLLASAAELAGELTKTGLAAGGRLLKDILARLPLN
jgi:hypothetical protein